MKIHMLSAKGIEQGDARHLCNWMVNTTVKNSTLCKRKVTCLNCLRKLK